MLVSQLTSSAAVNKTNDLISQFGSDLFLSYDSFANPLPYLPGLAPTNLVRAAPSLVSRTARWSHHCCGQEAAVTYLIEHRASFDYAWMVEEDVHFEGANLAKRFVTRMAVESAADLLHSNKNMSAHLHGQLAAWRWWFGDLHNDKVAPAAKLPPPYFMGSYTLVRLSAAMLGELSEWRDRNNGNWAFFEPLLGRLALGPENDLTEQSFADDDLFNASYFRFRPCWSREDVTERGEGIYHPVKGDFAPCSEVQGHATVWGGEERRAKHFEHILGKQWGDLV